MDWICPECGNKQAPLRGGRRNRCAECGYLELEPVRKSRDPINRICKALERIADALELLVEQQYDKQDND